MASIRRITVNYMEGPVGITGAVQFGWVLESEKANARQEWYEIRISESDDFRETIYESGQVRSDMSAHVEVDCAWKDIRRYFVQVRAGISGETTEWAETSFVSGYQDISRWSGRFITAESKDDADKSAGTLLRREFRVEGKVKAAYLTASAHGLYRAFLNGEKIGEDEFAPGWTSYDNRLLYQTYDITDQIREGVNAIGVELGAGWYKGEMSFNHVRNLYGKQTAFGGQMIIDLEDGERQIIATDETWKGSDGPILFSEIYDGEIYDARLEQDGWAEPGFDDSSWRGVSCVERDVNTLVPQEGCTVQKITRIDPVSLFHTPEGDLVVDFGQNMTGWCYTTMRDTTEGDRLELNFFETLDAAGNVYTANLRKAKETLVYTCRGKEQEICHPHFTFQGFRYAKIAAFPGTPELEDFTAYALHSSMEPTGDFSCSNPLLNQLQHNILWGMKGNFLDIPTDCPQRDERLGWSGDAQIFCRTATFLMNTYPFLKKWLQDVAADQAPDGGVAHVVPDILTGYSEDDWLNKDGTYGASAWGDVAVINPWTMYLAFGDKKILEQQYDSMKKWIDFMTANSTEGCMFNFGLQYGDWVALDAEEGSYFGATPTAYTCAAFYCHSTELFAKTAEILGETEDAERYRELCEKLKESFQEHFFGEDGRLAVQTQTAHIVALYFDLVPEKYRKITVEGLKKLLDKEDGHLVTGFIGTPYFTHALSQNGCLDEAYELLLKEDFPSWLYQVKMGATTVWEHWDGMKPDGTMWSPDMNSFNHYAYGSVGDWLYRVIGGLEIDEEDPGYHHFFIQPQAGGGLSWVNLSYESIYGRIEIHWEREEDRITLDISVPVNSSATVCLTQAKEIISTDIPDLNRKDAKEAEVGSGKWRVQFSI